MYKSDVSFIYKLIFNRETLTFVQLNEFNLIKIIKYNIRIKLKYLQDRKKNQDIKIKIKINKPRCE